MSRNIQLKKRVFTSKQDFIETDFVQGTIYNQGTSDLIFWGETIKPYQSWEIKQVAGESYAVAFDIDFLNIPNQ